MEHEEYLEELERRREIFRDRDRRLTQEIKKTREMIKEKKAKEKSSQGNVEEHRKKIAILKKENQRLRGLFATIEYLLTDKTYKEVGQHIGVSGSRARQLVERELRYYRWLDNRVAEKITGGE